MPARVHLLNPGNIGLAKAPMITIVDETKSVPRMDQSTGQIAWLFGAYVSSAEEFWSRTRMRPTVSF